MTAVESNALTRREVGDVNTTDEAAVNDNLLSAVLPGSDNLMDLYLVNQFVNNGRLSNYIFIDRRIA